MNNDMVAHAWAHGRAAKGSNYRTDGVTLWSYYTEIATNIDGIIYISANNMSMSTSRHVGYAKRACGYNNPNIFITPAFSWSGSDPAHTHLAMIRPCVDRATQALDTCLASNRRLDTKLNAIMGYNQERGRIIKHCVRVGIVPPEMPVYEVSEEVVKGYAARKAEEVAQAELKRQKAIKKQQKEDKKQFTAWLTTGEGSCPVSFKYDRVNGDYFTVRGDKIVTSQGAECPVDHAVKAIRFWQSRNGEPYHTNGHVIHLGIFTLDAIDAQGNVKAGCHTFTAATIQTFINTWKEVIGL